MRKIIKIILAVFAILLIIFSIASAIIFLDVASLTATNSQTLSPSGQTIGTALVAFDPGLTDDTKIVAQTLAENLQQTGYEVTLAGIKNSVVSQSGNFNIIVVGGPVYAGDLTSSVKEALRSLIVSQETKVAVFGSGQGATSPEDVAMITQSMPTRSDDALENAIVVKIGNTEDISLRAADLVNQLTQ
jgi:flavodoxin